MKSKIMKSRFSATFKSFSCPASTSSALVSTSFASVLVAVSSAFASVGSAAAGSSAFVASASAAAYIVHQTSQAQLGETNANTCKNLVCYLKTFEWWRKPLCLGFVMMFHSRTILRKASARTHLAYAKTHGQTLASASLTRTESSMMLLNVNLASASLPRRLV